MDPGSIMGLIGTGMSVMGSLNQADAARKMGAYTAAQDRQEGTLRLAEAQGAGQAEAERGAQVLGRARAIGAAQNAPGTSVSAILGELQNRGRYNTAAQTWKGEVAQVNAENAARAAEKGAAFAARGYDMNAIATAFGGASKAASNSGMKFPSMGSMGGGGGDTSLLGSDMISGGADAGSTAAGTGASAGADWLSSLFAMFA